MTPLRFDGCFGWLHPAEEGALPSRTGVLLCGTVGFEKQCLHRSWRMLAAELATAGIPALRFDYPGTGDAVEPPAGTGQVEAWLDAVRAAAWVLRREAGVDEIVLCGIHLGAALAAEAARAMPGVRRMALLAPVVSGRRYLRVLRVVASAAQAPPADEGVLEVAGLRLDEKARDRLGRMELTKLDRGTVEQVLVLGQAASKEEAALAAHLRGLGAEVIHRDLEGLDALMADSHLAVAPKAEWQAIARWVRDGSTATAPVGDPDQDAGTPVYLGSAPAPSGAVEEHPLRFGGAGRVAFGFYAAPRRHAEDRPAVLFCNTGANPHYGPGRVTVHLARSLAIAGTASLRVDLPGIGDGIIEPGDTAPHLYGTDRVPDLRRALDELERLGHRNVVLVGVCSGAFHAVRAAVADTRVSGLVLVNQLLWHWHPHPVLGLLRRIAGGARRAEIERQAGADAGGAMLQAQTVRTRVGWDKVRRGAMRTASVANRAATRLGVQTAWSFPERSIRRLSARGTRVMLVAGQDDAARTVLEGYLGPAGIAVSGLPGVQVRIVGDLDHAAASAAAGRTLAALLEEFLAADAPDTLRKAA